MSFNLVDSVKALFLSDTISNMASSLGESEGNIQKAINGAVPAALAGILNKAGNGGAAGISGILDLARQASNSSILGNLKVLISNDSNEAEGSVISNMIGDLFGDKLNGIIKAISAFAGIRESSGSSVMNMVIPATLATLGNHANVTKMGSHQLLAFLNTQTSSVISSVPSGLNLAGALGLGSLNSISNKISSFHAAVKDSPKKIVSAAADYEDHSFRQGIRAKRNIIWVLSLVLIALAIWLYGMNNRKSKSAAEGTLVAGSDSLETSDNTIVPTAKGTLDSLGNFVYNPGRLIKLALPGNSGQLEAGEFSTEAKLFFFLNDTSETIDTLNGNWFELTNVRFKTGSPTVTDESMAQLKNIVAIVKAYPAARFKIGGYTDNTGDSTKNVSLSQKRAEAVATLLKDLGASANSITGAEGYGPQWPIGDNDTDEGRAMNRRVAVNVKAK